MDFEGVEVSVGHAEADGEIDKVDDTVEETVLDNDRVGVGFVKLVVCVMEVVFVAVEESDKLLETERLDQLRLADAVADIVRVAVDVFVSVGVGGGVIVLVTVEVGDFVKDEDEVGLGVGGGVDVFVSDSDEVFVPRCRVFVSTLENVRERDGVREAAERVPVMEVVFDEL